MSAAKRKAAARRIWVDGEDRPRCSCHGERMYSSKDGSFKCAETYREHSRRRRAEHPEDVRESNRKYRATHREQVRQLGRKGTQKYRETHSLRIAQRNTLTRAKQAVERSMKNAELQY